MQVSVPELKSKLQNISSWFPDPFGQRYTYYFVDYLAEQLQGEITTPELFLMLVYRLSSELERDATSIRFGKTEAYYQAVDRFAAAKIFILMDLEKIIDIVFPPEFAGEVKKIMEEISQQLKD